MEQITVNEYGNPTTATITERTEDKILFELYGYTFMIEPVGENFETSEQFEVGMQSGICAGWEHVCNGFRDTDGEFCFYVSESYYRYADTVELAAITLLSNII